MVRVCVCFIYLFRDGGVVIAFFFSVFFLILFFNTTHLFRKRLLLCTDNMLKLKVCFCLQM